MASPAGASTAFDVLYDSTVMSVPRMVFNYRVSDAVGVSIEGKLQLPPSEDTVHARNVEVRRAFDWTGPEWHTCHLFLLFRFLSTEGSMRP